MVCRVHTDGCSDSMALRRDGELMESLVAVLWVARALCGVVVVTGWRPAGPMPIGFCSSVVVLHGSFWYFLLAMCAMSLYDVSDLAPVTEVRPKSHTYG